MKMIINIHGFFFKKKGAGAGAAVTAYGIFTDLLKIQERAEGF